MAKDPLDDIVYSTISFEVRIVSGARKHGLSRSRIEEALDGHVVADTFLGPTSDPKIRFVGADGRGVEIEVVAVVLPDSFSSFTQCLCDSGSGDGTQIATVNAHRRPRGRSRA
jgi:hypothetical protein